MIAFRSHRTAAAKTKFNTKAFGTPSFFGNRQYPQYNFRQFKHRSLRSGRCRHNLSLGDFRSMETHAEAELFALPACDGGRQSSFSSGYRSCIAFDDFYRGLTISLLDRDSMSGGDTARVTFSFHALPSFVGRLRVGLPFDIAEGARVVARGTIIAVLDPSLLSNDSPVDTN